MANKIVNKHIQRNILLQLTFYNRLVQTHGGSLLTNESVDNFFSIKIMVGASHEIDEVK